MVWTVAMALTFSDCACGKSMCPNCFCFYADCELNSHPLQLSSNGTDTINKLTLNTNYVH